jgi:hypothetical protein
MQTTDSDGAGFPDAERFGLLRNHRRRYVLRYLAMEGNPADFDEMVDTVAAWENDVPVEDVSSDQRKRVYVSLTQTHLPKLDDAGVIDYDETAGVVRRRPRAERLERDLGMEDDDRWPWPILYSLAALVGVALVVGHLLSIPVLGRLPVYGWLLLVVGLFLAISVADLLTDST